MAGYSGTPLDRKLGLKTGMRVVSVPADRLGMYVDARKLELQTVGPRSEADFIWIFATNNADLLRAFPPAQARLAPDGLIWVSWPKKSSGVVTDLDENKIREFGLSRGLVDVKVCAVDETWSGLKFVIRKADRARAGRS